MKHAKVHVRVFLNIILSKLDIEKRCLLSNGAFVSDAKELIIQVKSLLLSVRKAIHRYYKRFLHWATVIKHLHIIRLTEYYTKIEEYKEENKEYIDRYLSKQ